MAVDVLGPAGELLATRGLEGDRDDIVLTIGEGLDRDPPPLVRPTFVDSTALTSLRLRPLHRSVSHEDPIPVEVVRDLLVGAGVGELGLEFAQRF